MDECIRLVIGIAGVIVPRLNGSGLYGRQLGSPSSGLDGLS